MNVLQKILALPAGIYMPLLSSIGVLSVTGTKPQASYHYCHIEVKISAFNHSIDRDWTSILKHSALLYVRLPMFLEGELAARTRSPGFKGKNREALHDDYPRYVEAIAVAIANLETLENGPGYWFTRMPLESSVELLAIPTYYEVIEMKYLLDKPKN
jgi:hypothetical protein